MRRTRFSRKSVSAVVVVCCLIFGSLHGDASAAASFKNGQDATLVLGAPGFNNAGYLNKPGDGLLFNHPMNISTDGVHLLLADTRNNRVLIWNSLPETNVSPDVVLGQDNLTTNDPGTTLNRFNWPVGVSAASGKVVVSDTYNHRILIWNSFPTANGKPADLIINNLFVTTPWPWGVWTDGTKLIVCATMAGKVLIWNTFPTVSNQPPDIVLNGKNPADGTYSFGTPRDIGTDGKTYLIIGDHNSYQSYTVGAFFWSSFPSSDQPYDFVMTNPSDPGSLYCGCKKTSDGKLVALTQPFFAIWNSLPASAANHPDLLVGRYGNREDETCHQGGQAEWGDGFSFAVGDGSNIAITPSGKVYISEDNGNRVVGYRSLPTNSTQCPDFAIGAPNIGTNTLYAAGYVDTLSNAMPATDGKCLISTSDDCMLHVWRSLPTQSGTPPDLSYDFLIYPLYFTPSSNALYGSTFVTAGGGSQQQVWIWKSLPPDGNHPDLVFNGGIGTQSLQNIQGVALDDKYLYISDNGQVHVWKALPDTNTPPLFSLAFPQGAYKISSDGRYLAVIDGTQWFASFPYQGSVKIYDVSTLSSTSSPVAVLLGGGVSYRFFGPPQGGNVLIAHDHLFIVDGAGRVVVWNSIKSAIAGNDPDAVLGQPDLQTLNSGIGINRLFCPLGIAFDGNRLWVGEFKFSSRLVEYRAKNSPDAILQLLLMD